MSAPAAEIAAMRAEAVTVLGLTFKENVVDIRNSQVVDIDPRAAVIRRRRCRSTIRSPMPRRRCTNTASDAMAEDELAPADAVVLAVGHDRYRDVGLAADRAAAQERPRPGDGRQGHARSAPAAATDRTVAAVSGRHLRRPAMPAARRGSG